MLRRTPLKAKTPLRATKALKRTGYLKRTAMKRQTSRRKQVQSQAERDHMAWVASQPCCVSNRECKGRVEVHHITGGKSQSQKNDDFKTIPLCAAHHREGKHGVALHAGVETWEENFAPQVDLLAVILTRKEKYDAAHPPKSQVSTLPRPDDAGQLAPTP